MTEADLIWNRACGEHRLYELPGDRALANLINAHSLTMNGGVLHALECLTDDELAAAESGYSYFGFDEIVDLFRRATARLSTNDDLDELERGLDEEYATVIPSDEHLSERFLLDWQVNPSRYAPLRPIDRSH